VTKRLPGMRERRWDGIVVMASIAGLMGRLRSDGVRHDQDRSDRIRASGVRSRAPVKCTCNAIAPGIIAPHAKLGPALRADGQARASSARASRRTWPTPSPPLLRARKVHHRRVVTGDGGMDLFTLWNFHREDRMPTEESFDAMGDRFRATSRPGRPRWIQYDVSGDGRGRGTR